MFPLQHWFAVHMGIGTSPRAIFWYSWWSGAGSDLGELTLVGMLIGMYKVKLNCHEPGCPWPGSHTVTSDDGAVVRLCHKHHPGVAGNKLTHADIVGVYAQHKARMTDEQHT